MNNILNASPQVINLGINDLSTRVITPQPIELPQHLAKFFIYGKKGSTKPTLTEGNQMLLQYGADTFDENHKWFNHATKFVNGVVGAGNAVMLQRIVPIDAGPESNAIIYMDIVEDDVPNYVRNSSGNYVMDTTTNSYKTDGTITGYRVKFIKEYANKQSCCPDAEGNLEDIGSAVPKTGTMTAVNGGATSTMYPIIELRAAYKGEYYNNIGISISSLKAGEIDPKIVNSLKALPYNLSLVTRVSESQTPHTIFPSLYGESSVQFSFVDKAINPNTGSRMDIETIFDKSWFNETDELLPLKYNDYQGIKIYRDNLKTVTELLAASEQNYLSDNVVAWDDGGSAANTSWFDWGSTDLTGLEGLLNIFTLKSTSNVNYLSIINDNTSPSFENNRQSVIDISSTTTIWLSGGSDGTLSNGMFETGVVAEMQKYLDPDSEVMDNAINVESVMYDSGYTMDTKKELCNFIAVRKDTAVALTPHEATDGESFKPLSDQKARADVLKARLKLTPESSYYGTSVARGIVVAGTGTDNTSMNRNRVPLLYSIAIKSAKFMGSGTGKWKGVEAFDGAPGNIITELVDIEPKFIPAGIKPTLWNSGIVWAQPYDMKQFHFPAIQTVYDNDTSVLNSWTTIMAACTLTKIADNAWRNFTGVTDLTEAELSNAIVDFVNASTQNAFDNRIVVIPEVQFTAADKERGYSWRLVNNMYANNMKSVMVYTTNTYRISDLNS